MWCGCSRVSIVLVLLGWTAAVPAEQPTISPAPGHALLIGVGAYEHALLTPLAYAENDVEAMARELDRPGSPFHKRVRLLTTARGQKNAAEQPTAANIKAAVAKLVAERTRQETVLLALTGHGMEVPVPDPAGKGEERSYGYFCPADAQLSGIDYRTGRSERLVLVPELLQQLGDCGAGSKLLVMDACRNEVRLKTRALRIRRDMVPEGVAALFSCKPGEFSYESSKLKHGVFVHFLLEGLRGGAKNARGQVTWARLAEYVTEKVAEDASELLGEKVVQTPHHILNLAGRSPVLAGSVSEAERLYRQGLALYHGTGCKVDRLEAPRLFRRAAEQGHDMAPMALAVCQVQGYGDERVDSEAADWGRKGLAGVRTRAEGGDAQAQVWLGNAYRYGLGVAKDEVEAVAWYRKASAQDDASGQDNLGWCYQFGVGVSKDAVEAVRWYRKAAEQNLAVAQCNLGRCYLNGWGVADDNAEAVRWFRKAAAQNLANAQYYLGWCYLYRWGVPKDEVEAVRWFRKAVEQNLASAQDILGYCYQYGRGVPLDLAEAKRWYEKAAAQGNESARKQLRKLK